MTSSESHSWYVAETQPRKEALAALHLGRQSFDFFLPRYRKARRHARKFDTVLAPLFPGYVFVRFDREQANWRSINGTFGIRRLLCGEDGMLQPMPTRVVQALQARCNGDIFDASLDSLKPGEKVRILHGPFADLIAQVKSLDDRGRVALLLDIMGGGLYHSETRSVERA
ncbi:MAG: transcriptional activator RfaH [Sphingomonadales bacterium]|nr:transcriptional activator RfaH [Sphingomonadales bacterium]